MKTVLLLFGAIIIIFYTQRARCEPETVAQTQSSLFCLRNNGRLERTDGSDCLSRSDRIITSDEIAREVSRASLDFRIENQNKRRERKKKFRLPGSRRVSYRNTMSAQFVTNPKAENIGRAGRRFSKIVSRVQKRLGVHRRSLTLLTELVEASLQPDLNCPFARKIHCDKSARFRSADGSCNNLDNPYWGMSNSPFETNLKPAFDDGFNRPRTKAESGGKLPSSRKISTVIHKRSTSRNLMRGHSDVTMTFGQFASHDIQSLAGSKGENGESVDCCKAGLSKSDRDICFVIDIPSDDEHFSRWNKTCMNFVRSLPSPRLDCMLGPRAQLNQVTHFLDGSSIYGSDENLMNALRDPQRGKGHLKCSPDDRFLPNINAVPLDSALPVCIANSSSTTPCFVAGDLRPNVQPGLASMHTVWMKEHNRVAQILSRLQPTWDDEGVFQWARKIVVGELQYITYNEYLPSMLSPSTMGKYNLNFKRGYRYRPKLNPTIDNGFMLAALRFGHSQIRDTLVSIDTKSRKRHDSLFKDIFRQPTVVYTDGISNIAEGWKSVETQSADRFMSAQIRDHLFETKLGNGLDLVAMNIQRGRDAGIPGYNTWRAWCDLPIAHNFTTGKGGLADMDETVVADYATLYSHPGDMDIFSAGMAETPVKGGHLGPLFECMIGRQFSALAYGDRFFYANTDPLTGFTKRQIKELSKASMSRILCDTTDIKTIQSNAFYMPEASNQIANCTELPRLDLTKLMPCPEGSWTNWSGWSRCILKKQFRTRRCRNSVSGCKGNCVGSRKEFRSCSNSVFASRYFFF